MLPRSGSSDFPLHCFSRLVSPKCPLKSPRCPLVSGQCPLVSGRFFLKFFLTGFLGGGGEVMSYCFLGTLSEGGPARHSLSEGGPVRHSFSEGGPVLGLRWINGQPIYQFLSLKGLDLKPAPNLASRYLSTIPHLLCLALGPSVFPS